MTEMATRKIPGFIHTPLFGTAAFSYQNGDVVWYAFSPQFYMKLPLAWAIEKAQYAVARKDSPTHNA